MAMDAEMSKRREESSAAAENLVVLKSLQPEYLKPRDAFGGGAHLRDLQLHQLQQQGKDLCETSSTGSGSKVIKPPAGSPFRLSSSSPLVNAVPAAGPQGFTTEQLQLLRAQQDMITTELNMFFQGFLKQGHPEGQAIQLAHRVVEERFANNFKGNEQLPHPILPHLPHHPHRPDGVPSPLLETSSSTSTSSTSSYRPPSRQQLPPQAHSNNGASVVTVSVPSRPSSGTPDPYLRQSESPLALPAHAHSRLPFVQPSVTPDHLSCFTAGQRSSVVATAARQASSPAAHQQHHQPPPPPPQPVLHHHPHQQQVQHGPMSMEEQQLLQQQQQQQRSLSPAEFNFEPYPKVWQGQLGLKTEIATVQFHYVSGCKDLARLSLPMSPEPGLLPTLRIGQRMRLEASHLSGVQRKMLQTQEHCVLLALPCGKDALDVEAQSRHLRNHFITYLQLKGAAGIVNVEGIDQAAYVVHVFPSCDFANETMSGIAPDLLARVAEIEHMVIIIATVFDK